MVHLTNNAIQKHNEATYGQHEDGNTIGYGVF